MKAFKGIGFQLVLSFAVAVCVAIILVSLGSIRITKTSINANTEVTSEQTLDNVQEGFTTYLKTLSQPVDLLTRKNEIKHLEDQGNLDDNVKIQPHLRFHLMTRSRKHQRYSHEP